MSLRQSFVRRSLTTTALLAFAGAGCATDPVTDDPDIDPDDTTAPAVATTQPVADAAGVRSDEQIHVTFSEPMDQASVEAAYASTDLPAGEVTFAWNPDGTVLTITPTSPLAYAEGAGTDPDMVTARTYHITIGAGATDLAGNALPEPMELSFTTRRRLVALFGLDLDLTRVTLGNIAYAATEIMVGDFTNTAKYRSYLTFDLTTLPASAEVEQAQFQGRQLLTEGTPYSLGNVGVQHLTFTSTLAVTLNAVTPTSLPGAISADPMQGIKMIDVTSQVIDDVAHRAERNDRSQYRLQFDQDTNGDGIADRATFGKNTFVLGVMYVVD